MGINPSYKIFANQQDITSNIQNRLVKLSISDSAGIESDTLNIIVDDSDDRVEIPATGVRLEVLMGYGEELLNMGSFVVDDLSFSSTPQRYTIRASAAPVEGSNTNAMQSQKSRSFENTTLEEVVKTVAAENNLEAFVSQSLKNTLYQNLEQTAESDLNMVTRLANDLNAIAKPAGGKLLFVKQGEGKSSSGEKLATISIVENEVSSYNWRESKSTKAGTVKASYHNLETGETEEVQAGEGEPIFSIKYQYPSKEEAERAARNRLEQNTQNKSTLNIQMAGNASLSAELKLNLTGFRKTINGEWTVKTVQHDFDKSSGYVCNITATRG